MKKLLQATAVVAVMSCAAYAANVQALYAPCAGCHGAQGQTVALGASKIIKDMTREDFIASMKGYQDGTYGGRMKAVMAPQVAKLSDSDIEALADHIVK